MYIIIIITPSYGGTQKKKEELLTAIGDLQLDGQTDPGRGLVSAHGGAPLGHQLDHAVVEGRVRDAHLREVQLAVVGDEQVRVEVRAQEVARGGLHPPVRHRYDR